MKNTQAIVTLVLGEKYLNCWKRDCEENWQTYAQKHGYDVICLDQPLDQSQRAAQRSPSWQKCLILSQGFASDYERIIWVDSDIVINTTAAPSITDNLPIEKVGAVELFTYSKQAGTYGAEALKRMSEYWQRAIPNTAAQDYYKQYGFAQSFDTVVQAGVLALSPVHHRNVLEKIYYQYEEKGGAEWHYEMRPLSYELLMARMVHWLDPRFNLLWADHLFLYYPFLIDRSLPRNLIAKVMNKIGRTAGLTSTDDVWHACQCAAFLNSYFFHFGGADLDDMETLNKTVTSWRNCQL